MRLALIIALLCGCAAAGDFNAAAPNAVGQRPAFPAQTRAPILRDAPALSVETLATGLEHPWGLSELPEGGFLVTERAGRMRLISPDGAVSAPIAGLPEIAAEGQGGLLDVVIGPGFARDRRLWWSYAEPRVAGRSATAVATGALSGDGARIEGARVIFRQQPAIASGRHFGARLVFGRDGALFVTTGDRGRADTRPLAQDLSTHLGKVLRIDPEGGAAQEPIRDGAAPEIWSYGHRNIQAAALDAQGDLWTVEHGPRGGDELNRPELGANHGWPVISYGEAYSGAPIGAGLTAQGGMVQPLYYWDPVIAPSGMAFYDGDLFPDWRGDALIGGLASRALVRLRLEAGRVIGEARHLEGRARIRDVAVARDGAVLLLTDAPDGALWRVTPAR